MLEDNIRGTWTTLPKNQKKKNQKNLSQQTIIERMIQILSLCTNFSALILIDNI